jgi:uncharacterized membrane protein
MNRQQQLFVIALLLIIIFALIPGKITLWIAAIVVSLISAVFTHVLFNYESKYKMLNLTEFQKFIISSIISGTFGFITGYALGEKLKTHIFFHDL